jgi:hypothetical protein
LVGIAGEDDIDAPDLLSPTAPEAKTDSPTGNKKTATTAAAVIADYDAQSAVERELVLRLASLLWRLRRATTMETGLFEIQAESWQLLADSGDVVHTLFQHSHESAPADSNAVPHFGMKAYGSAIEFAHCFLRLANLPNFALDRLSQYEAILWRQTCRVLYALETLDRREPQERSRRFWVGEQISAAAEYPVLKQRSSEASLGCGVGPFFAQIVPAQCHWTGKNLAAAGQAKAGG